MTSDDVGSTEPDELELLRHEARAVGMPGEIAPASVGITPRSPEEILRRARSRVATDNEVKALFASTRPRRKILIRLGAAAASIAVVLGVTFIPWHQNKAIAIVPQVLDYELANVDNIATAPGVDAQAVLMDLSEKAKRQPAIPVSGPTQYVMTDSWFAEVEENTVMAVRPVQVESWQRDDGSFHMRERFGVPMSPDGRRITNQGVGDVRTNEVTDDVIPAEDGDPQFVATLGTDPRDVRTALLDLVDCPSRDPGSVRTFCLFREVEALNSSYVIPPKTAAALWRVLADESGLRSLGKVKDRAGRTGVGISFIRDDQPEFRNVLIVSSKTGKLLGSERILIKNLPDLQAEAPMVLSFSAYLEARYTTKRGPSD
jgi:hypothetical protein